MKEKKLSLREYIGILKPQDPDPKRPDGLTIDEYKSTSPILSLSEVAALIKQAGRGIRRFFSR